MLARIPARARLGQAALDGTFAGEERLGATDSAHAAALSAMITSTRRLQDRADTRTAHPGTARPNAAASQQRWAGLPAARTTLANPGHRTADRTARYQHNQAAGHR